MKDGYADGHEIGHEEGHEVGLKEGLEKGRKEGLEQGLKEGQLLIAKRLKALGISTGEIIKANGLSEADLHQI